MFRLFAILLLTNPLVIASEGPSSGPVLVCPRAFADLEKAELESMLRKRNYTLDDPVYARHADGRPFRLEFVIQDANDLPVAALEVELREGGDEAHIVYVWRGQQLENFRVAGWLKKKMIEKYPLKRISQVLSETEMERLEKGLKAGEKPELAVQRTVAYKNCLELGFARTEVGIFGNSATLVCAR